MKKEYISLYVHFYAIDKKPPLIFPASSIDNYFIITCKTIKNYE